MGGVNGVKGEEGKKEGEEVRDLGIVCKVETIGIILLLFFSQTEIENLLNNLKAS